MVARPLRVPFPRWAFVVAAVAFNLAGCTSLSPNGAGSAGGTRGTADAPRVEAARLARQIHEAVNRERVRRSLPPLEWNNRLADIAAAHSRDMAAQGYFSHVNPRGEDATARAARADFECNKVSGNTRTYGLGENIFMATRFHRYVVRTSSTGERTRSYEWKTLTEMVDETVDSWMNSPGHRANILNPTYDTEGIGVSTAGYEFYVTQNFC